MTNQTEAIAEYRRALTAANGIDIDSRRIEQLVAAYALGWAEARLSGLRQAVVTFKPRAVANVQAAVYRDAAVVDGPVHSMSTSGIVPPLVAINPCSWCEAEIGYRTNGSHGICERHRKSMLAQVETQVETLGAPADTEGA